MPQYPRPTELTITQIRDPVAGSCPQCGKEDLRRYPVNTEGGWWQVVKCQSCLHSVRRERWALLGSLELLPPSL